MSWLSGLFDSRNLPDDFNGVGSVDDYGVGEVAITCDYCGTEFRGDFVGHGFDDRVGYARDHLETQGWSCTHVGDVCPSCVPRHFELYSRGGVFGPKLVSDHRWENVTIRCCVCRTAVDAGKHEGYSNEELLASALIHLNQKSGWVLSDDPNVPNEDSGTCPTCAAGRG